MLHTVNKSSFERNSLQSCLDIIDEKSVILLLEDGVICAADNTKSSMLAQLAADGKVFALKGDVEARGISAKLAENIQLVDYSGFVDLVVEHGTAVSWL
ncbi:MAG: sulfurtransferase complex subunit TusB [Candidatus Thioglobus sp.]|nr:sulfurtransferase complex subunit TusB [Candidatus Thioglobus sp.]